MRSTLTVPKDAIKEGDIYAMLYQFQIMNSLFISLICLSIVQNIKLPYLISCTQWPVVGLTTMIRFHQSLILVLIQKLVQESTTSMIGGSCVLMTMKSSANSLGGIDRMKIIPARQIQHGLKSSEQPHQLIDPMRSKD